MISYIVNDEQVSSQKLWTWLNPNSAWTTRRASLLSETMNFDWTQTVHEQPGEQVSSQKLRTLIEPKQCMNNQESKSPLRNYKLWLNPNSAWTTRRASLLSETMNLIEPKQCMNNQESKSPLRNYELDWTQTVHEQPGEQVSSQKLWTLIEPKQCMNNQESKSPLRNYKLDWTQTVHEQPGEQVSSQKLQTWLNPNSAWTTRRASLLSETMNLIEPKQCMNNQESKSPLRNNELWLNPNSAWTTRRASLLSETTNFDWTQTVHEQPGEQVSSQKLRTLIEPKQCMNNQESKSPLRNYELWLNRNSAWTTRRASLLSETTNFDWTETVHEQPGEQVSSQKLQTLIEPKQCMNNQESKSPLRNYELWLNPNSAWTTRRASLLSETTNFYWTQTVHEQPGEQFRLMWASSFLNVVNQ